MIQKINILELSREEILNNYLTIQELKQIICGNSEDYKIVFKPQLIMFLEKIAQQRVYIEEDKKGEDCE